MGDHHHCVKEIFAPPPMDVTLAAVASMMYLITIFRLDGWRHRWAIVFPVGYRIGASRWFRMLGWYSRIAVVSLLIPYWLFLDPSRSSFCGARLAPPWLDGWTRGWMRTFFWSKMVEFGDTVWLILANRNQIKLLQWFHHLVTLWYVLYSMTWFPGTGIVFAIVNLAVHSIMYPYLADSIHPSRKPSVPAWMITTAQIVQMVAGVVVSVYHHIRCRPPVWDLIGITMFGIYGWLFVELYKEKYGPPRPIRSSARDNSQVKTR